MVRPFAHLVLLTHVTCSFKAGPENRGAPAHAVVSASCLVEEAGSFGAWKALAQLSLAAHPWASHFFEPLEPICRGVLNALPGKKGAVIMKLVCVYIRHAACFIKRA